MKTCKGCKIQKLLDDFYPILGNRDGRSGTCKTCTIEKVRQRTDIQAKQEYDRKHYKENAAKIKVRVKKYYVENKEIVTEVNERWRLNNPEARRAMNARRRMRVRINMTPEDRAESVAWRKKIKCNPCYYCGEIKEVMEDEHLIPLSRGGTDHWWNIERACKDCNTRKGTQDHMEFLAL